MYVGWARRFCFFTRVLTFDHAFVPKGLTTRANRDRIGKLYLTNTVHTQICHTSVCHIRLTWTFVQLLVKLNCSQCLYESRFRRLVNYYNEHGTVATSRPRETTIEMQPRPDDCVIIASQDNFLRNTSKKNTYANEIHDKKTSLE